MIVSECLKNDRQVLAVCSLDGDENSMTNFCGSLQSGMEIMEMKTRSENLAVCYVKSR